MADSNNRRLRSFLEKAIASRVTPIAASVVVILLVVLLQMLYTRDPAHTKKETISLRGRLPIPRAVRDSTEAAVRTILNGHRLEVRRTAARDTGQTLWVVQVPADLPLPSVHFEIQERLDGTHASILRASTDPQTRNLTIEIGQRDSCFLRVVLVPASAEAPAAGKIALVIDDFGDRIDTLVQAFFQLDGAITISVIPGRKWSSKVARTASGCGCEVILHLAMEPLRAAFKEDGFTILTKMPREDIQATFQHALDQVPGAIGVNNHMGSRATSDRQTMLDVLESVKQRGLYFVDSRTVASTVAYDVAVQLGVPTAKRDVFVDVNGAEEAIRQKLWDLAGKAKANGRAVGIGHCHSNMLVALQKEMPKLKDAGYRFVTLSNIVR